ncbi:uncharacterized protein LOC118433002 [Folsomia candida]|uniref:uncharacterized protein LOC118433002 n=1 Tax=Folsomia candida TaxID=158441 RepID=UPI0016054775|nr:uncharacterized protein LOC118433002 [Folsomia candida]
MPPNRGHESNNNNLEATRIKYTLHTDQGFPSTTEIAVQFDLMTPALVINSFPDTETIRGGKLFHDVHTFVVRHFATLNHVKDSKYHAKLVLHSTTYATYCYYFASNYEKQLYFATIHAWGAILDDWIENGNALNADRARVEILGCIEEFIATGTNKEVMPPQSDPFLHAIMGGYAECEAMADEIIPDYLKQKHDYVKGLKNYLHSNAWGLMDSSLKGYSFEQFLHWRNLESGIFLSTEILMLCENATLPKHVGDHVMVKTLRYM